MSQRLLLILGNQLFPPACLPDDLEVYMAEDIGLCTYERHHQQKIVLFLAAMRHYAQELEDAGYTVHYHRLDPGDDRSYCERLNAFVDDREFSELIHFEIEDKPFESALLDWAAGRELERCELESPMFLTPRSDFAEWLEGKERLVMADFYKRQRRRLGVLLNADGKPVGGRWSFDEENRKKLPKDVNPPAIEPAAQTDHVKEVVELVKTQFADHPGDAEEFWWPVTRDDAEAWLQDFLDDRLDCFGPYEDAISTRTDTVFHSALSPALNLGLITPRSFLDRLIRTADERDVPLASQEGLIRQIIGWREFIRGVYRTHSDEQDAANHFDHQRELTDAWYDGSTGIPILDDAIRTAQRLGWTHHIIRLMVLGNFMTLCEIRPRSAHRWFMEMFIDSSEWVMGPNVYGMALFSDGGLFATKPYICGSNYLLKMSDYGKGEWCDVVDGLYWRFIDRHREFFSSNPRLALMPRSLDRLADERKERIFAAAEAFLDEHTTSG